MKIIFKIADKLGLSDEKLDELMDWAEVVAPSNPLLVAENELRHFELASHGSTEYTTPSPLLALA